MRGNNVMKGYLKNPSATAESFVTGSGRMDPSRSRTVRRTSSSRAVKTSPASRSRTCSTAIRRFWKRRWWRRATTGGPAPCAFVALRPGAEATAEEIVGYCRDHLAHFKAPRHVVFCELPKTSTGKVQKFLLRDRAESL